MKCPIDGTELTMTDRSGVEIDYCSKCRGIWLDRGELDKIIDRVAETVAGPSANTQPPPYPQQQSYPPQYGGKHGGYGRKKRKGMLGELFDF